ncbi:helix-turn-helix domain-containing protein [Streptomyces ziwulingensis]|uniref:XRE family transcriptional regulator n=1 Tax=Streptomyces ziwulingensis TaxID=1045501 RepID=A0ABP9CF27_9ACTN
MPRWKALPDELDPQIREFAGQLRRLVDRGELSIAALADATGYSKTSWERYLNGRLLAPKGAVVALAEVTRTNPVHLTTMWELAERVWSRSEMRHDLTMEAIRISQARTALGAPPAGTEDEVRGEAGDGAGGTAGTEGAGGAGGGAGASGGRGGRRGGSAVLMTGIAGPAGVAPTLPPVPAQPTAADSADSAGRRNGPAWSIGNGGKGGGGATVAPAAPEEPSDAVPGTPSGVNSWGMAGYRGPSPSGRGQAVAPGGRPGGPGANGTAGVPVRDATMALGGPGTARAPRPRTVRPSGGPDGPGGRVGPPPGGRGGASPRRGGKRLTTFVAGAVGVLVVLVGAFLLLDDRGEGERRAEPSPSPTLSTDADLPPGVKCGGDQCTGKDAEAMGCGGDLVTTERTVTVGTALVEVRYSETCGTAWGRVTQAGQGDEVAVSVGEAELTGSITTAGDTIAYTPMVAVKNATDATACVTLASGQKGCTE